MRFLVLLALAAAPASAQDCMAPWGQMVRNGDFVRAWNFQVAPRGFQCMAESRFCQNGFLSGTYMHQDCIQTPGLLDVLK